MDYKIKLDIFEGPLDLLLYLIQKDELDIHDIPINWITEQYLEYMNLMQSLNLDIAGEFLVMASTLMRIKSKMLLPVQEEEVATPEEDPRAELVQRLLEYMQYKEAAREFRTLGEVQSGRYTRPEQELEIQVDPLALTDISLFDLIKAFSRVIQQMPVETFHQVIRDEYTVAQKVDELMTRLDRSPRIRFTELFTSLRNKLEAITLFLALLELTRLKQVMFQQDKTYGDIEIMRSIESPESVYAPEIKVQLKVDEETNHG